LSFIYILTNESMPGYIKIGKTASSVKQRMLELDKTPVPLPFQCYYAARVEDYDAAEKMLHEAFAPARVRERREFFFMDPYRAKVVLQYIALEDMTPREDIFADDEAEKALVKATKHSRRYNFAENGIPIGAILVSTQNSKMTCEVVDDTSVRYEDEIMSVSKAATLANRANGFTAAQVSGTIYWLYEDETLNSIRSNREVTDASQD
jgi:hypothetical protein